MMNQRQLDELRKKAYDAIKRGLTMGQFIRSIDGYKNMTTAQLSEYGHAYAVVVHAVDVVVHAVEFSDIAFDGYRAVREASEIFVTRIEDKKTIGFMLTEVLESEERNDALYTIEQVAILMAQKCDESNWG